MIIEEEEKEEIGEELTRGFGGNGACNARPLGKLRKSGVEIRAQVHDFPRMVRVTAKKFAHHACGPLRLGIGTVDLILFGFFCFICDGNCGKYYIG